MCQPFRICIVFNSPSVPRMKRRSLPRRMHVMRVSLSAFVSPSILPVTRECPSGCGAQVAPFSSLLRKYSLQSLEWQAMPFEVCPLRLQHRSACDVLDSSCRESLLQHAACSTRRRYFQAWRGFLHSIAVLENIHRSTIMRRPDCPLSL
jgi:hypothetical protein